MHATTSEAREIARAGSQLVVLGHRRGQHSARALDGYGEDDLPDLVPGAMKQQRLLATCPRPVTEDDVAAILTRSIENW